MNKQGRNYWDFPNVSSAPIAYYPMSMQWQNIKLMSIDLKHAPLLLCVKMQPLETRTHTPLTLYINRSAFWLRCLRNASIYSPNLMKYSKANVY